MRVKAVTGFVPLKGVKPRGGETGELTFPEYHRYADRLKLCLGDALHVFRPWPLEACWLYQWLEARGMNMDKLAVPYVAPADRFETAQAFAQSNIVQHERLRWMELVALSDPTIDVLVWLDYAVLKQGAFTGKRVTEDHVWEFMRRIESTTNYMNDIPFPGCWDKREQVSDTGDNWRFVGSTHIIPRKFLFEAGEWYRHECREFIKRTRTIPLDLPIWALTEQNSALPFRFYQANHDFTQLTNFPDMWQSPLCRLARKYGTDKGGRHLFAGDTCHNYTPTYWMLLEAKRDTAKNVLEIGVHTGASLRMWEEFFPYARIIGLDKNQECFFSTARISCRWVDQSNPGDLGLIHTHEYDLIVDDGSHEPEHQILSARTLMPYLAEDGIYVIEDLQKDCQPELVGNPIVAGRPWRWEAIPVGFGIGRAHCECGCGTEEQLLVIRHAA